MITFVVNINNGGYNLIFNNNKIGQNLDNK